MKIVFTFTNLIIYKLTIDDILIASATCKLITMKYKKQLIPF